MNSTRASAFCALFVIAAGTTAHAAVPQKERDALVAIYDATGGPQWTNTDNWKGASGTECVWYGVTCNDTESTVVALNLGGNLLNGTVPPAIADLTNLEDLELQANNLSGTIPSQIGQLTKLTKLDLSFSNWSGEIPDALGSLANLVTLDLRENHLSGSIPPQLGNLILLEQIQLSVNALTGPIPPQLGQLVNLRSLSFGNNQLSGAIPSELGALSMVDEMRIDYNALTGPIPKTFGRLTSLQYLDLTNNQLDGAIPAEIGDLPAIIELYVGSNRLSGEIPAALYRLTTLQYLFLAGNQLTGTISTDVSRLSALQFLYLGSNQFTGDIPFSAITSLRQLRELDLSVNNLTGSIPSDIDRLDQLTVLSLGANNLSGTLPASLGRLATLQYLSLYSDHLTGTVPPELGSLGNLIVLSLDDNQLTGTIPDTLRNLRSLDQFSLSANQLTGTVPDWFPQLTKLTLINLEFNRLTGTIPESITAIPTLEALDLAQNVLTGTIPANIGNLTALSGLALADNELSGPIPDSLWNLHSLTELRLDRNHLSGPLSPRVAELTKLQVLLLGDNEIEGAIPPELGQVRPLLYLQLYGNHFRGAIPPQLGDLSNLLVLDLGSNDLHGEIPIELRKLTTLTNLGSGFDKNALTVSDPAFLAFLNLKEYDSDVLGSQTLPVTNVTVTATTDRSATVQWTPIAYAYELGGYQVKASLSPNGNPVSVTTTANKYVESTTIRNLDPGTTYFITVTTITYPHDVQRNIVVSNATPAVTATTGPRVDSPAEVIVTQDPTGLVEIDGAAQNEDSFTLTNFGDATTTITLERTDSFFAVSPETFTLAGGASQVVRVTVVPQPEGFYFGSVVLQGDGTSDSDYVDITLLSVVRPASGAIAESLTSRVEVVEVPGVPSAGSVTFRNRGTVTLTGILESDVPWIIPPREPIQIAPDEERGVTFTVDRTRRPESEGTSTGTLTFVYIGGTLGAAGHRTVVAQSIGEPAATSGTSTTRVVVVDITKPPVAPGTIPPLGPGEVAFSIPGITALSGAKSSLVSDLDILNAFGSRPITDMRLYFANASLTSVATLASLAASQSLSFANVVSSVYGTPSPVGALQVRSRDWEDLLVSGRILRLGDRNGTVAGDLPVFRSDRVIAAGQTLRLTGIRQSGSLKTTMYVQELTGAGSRAHVDFLNASGTKLGERDADLAGFAFTEMADVVPAGTVTALVRNSGSGGGLVAYARISDQTSGDSWSVVDWKSYFNYLPGSPMLIPVVETAANPQSPGRRRAASHATSTTASSTELTMFNGSASDFARVFLKYNGSQKEVVIAPRTTTTIDVASMFGAAATGPLQVLQDKGDVAITTRIAWPSPNGGAFGQAVPALAAQSGLRVGQARVFSNIEDPSPATIAAATAGTFRATYSLVETGGASVTVRASVSLPDGRTLIRVARDIVLAPNQFMTFDGVVKSIIGDTRDTRYADLHNLQLRLEVTNGNGSVVPFVTVTENATGDSVLRLE